MVRPLLERDEKSLLNKALKGKRKIRLQGKGTHTKQEIEALLKKQDELCAYCQKELSVSGNLNYHLDHKIPLSRGGMNTIDNIAITCEACNLEKGALTDDEFFTYRKSKSPRRYKKMILETAEANGELKPG